MWRRFFFTPQWSGQRGHILVWFRHCNNEKINWWQRETVPSDRRANRHPIVIPVIWSHSGFLRLIFVNSKKQIPRQTGSKIQSPCLGFCLLFLLDWTGIAQTVTCSAQILVWRPQSEYCWKVSVHPFIRHNLREHTIPGSLDPAKPWLSHLGQQICMMRLFYDSSQWCTDLSRSTQIGELNNWLICILHRLFFSIIVLVCFYE